jgi:hypothetical protein
MGKSGRLNNVWAQVGRHTGVRLKAEDKWGGNVNGNKNGGWERHVEHDYGDHLFSWSLRGLFGYLALIFFKCPTLW